MMTCETRWLYRSPAPLIEQPGRGSLKGPLIRLPVDFHCRRQRTSRTQDIELLCNLGAPFPIAHHLKPTIGNIRTTRMAEHLAWVALCQSAKGPPLKRGLAIFGKLIHGLFCSAREQQHEHYPSMSAP